MSEQLFESATMFGKSGSPRPGKALDSRRRHMRECCAIALKHFLRDLPEMLDQVDDALFLLAEKADHDNTQKLYFDAMREVRIKRPGIEKHFKDYLLDEFEAVSHVRRVGGAVSQSLDVTGPGLSLVEDDVLEESLAVTNMANRITGLCKDELFALDMRIGWLLDDAALEEHNNPLAPRSICEAFDRACSDIEAGTEIKLIVLKLFDKHMVATVQSIYQEINQYLVRNDILPYIRAEVKKQPHSVHPGTTDSATVGATGSCVTAAGGATAAAGSDPGLTAGTQGQAACAAGSIAGPGQPLSPHLSQELLATLQQVMRVNGAALPAQSDFSVESCGPELLGHLTSLQLSPATCQRPGVTAANGNSETGFLRELRQNDLSGELSHGEELMIDVVAMMFDYIFEDENIPAPMKALIGRLQIPLLKVALVDKSFFSRRFHPARKLLNTLAEAAVGWNQSQNDDELYAGIEQTVQRVLDEFEDQIEIFTEILADFEALIESDAKEAEETAWWAVKVVQGRERLANARSLVEELMCKWQAQLEYQFLASFIDEYWQNLLLNAYVKEGEDSSAWRDSLATAEDLIWSVTPRTGDQDSARLSAMLPDLLARLKKGIARASLPEPEAALFLAKLARIHLARVLGHDIPTEDELDALKGGSLPSVSQSSTTTGDELAETVNKAEPLDTPCLDQDSQHLQTALETANACIYSHAQQHPECNGMGTTMVAAWFRDGQVICAHAGDSRLYRLRDAGLAQITLDHSLRQQMVSNGFYTMEEAIESIASNLVTRALGVDSEVEIDVQCQAVESGDIYLLCSDGLSDLVEDKDIEQILNDPELELESAALKLIQMANDNGGTDNISVSLVQLWQAADEQVEDAELWEIVSRTDVGRRRAHNEDAQGEDPEIGLVVLADGMGGYNAGEVASRLAVDAVLEVLRETEVPAPAEQEINIYDLNALFDSATESSPEAGFSSQAHDGAQDLDGIGSETGAGEVEAHHVAQVASMEIGAWVEFRNRADVPIRARLSWISESTGNYLFTDRHGHKVVDATPAGLAFEFCRDSAVLIDEVPLFERAVNHLMTRLHPEAG